MCIRDSIKRALLGIGEAALTQHEAAHLAHAVGDGEGFRRGLGAGAGEGIGQGRAHAAKTSTYLLSPYLDEM